MSVNATALSMSVVKCSMGCRCLRWQVVSRVLRTILSGRKRQRGWRAETERTIDSIVSVMTPAPGVTDRRKHGLPFSVVRHSLLALPRSLLRTFDSLNSRLINNYHLPLRLKQPSRYGTR